MERRDFLGTAAASAALTLGAQPRTAARNPNIIVILTDDHGSGDLGCYGARDLKTPHLDRLAADGVRFTEWYANAPMCAPSRAALLTGRHPIRCGVPSNGPQLPAGEKTIAALLKEHGYRTGLTGKWHLGIASSNSPQDHGFDTFYGFHSGCVDFYSHRYYWGEPRIPNYHDLYRGRQEIFEDGQYLTERITAEAKSFIRQAKDQPFFLFAAYNAPHYPMHAPPKYLERFRGLPEERRMYAAMIAAVDDGVGEIRALVEELGLTRDTIVIFAADNGATTEPRAGLASKPATAGFNRGFRGYKFSLFDGGVHVPMVMAWPGKIPAGRTSSQIGSHYDLLPTLLAAAGLPARPEGFFDGVNLWDAVRRGEVMTRTPLCWQSGGQMAMRKGQWKLVLNGFDADGTAGGRKPLEGEDSVYLSNLEEDLGEKRNLRRAFPQIVEEMDRELRQRLDTIQKSSSSRP